jgi:SAM-dependent methyltransferase
MDRGAEPVVEHDWHDTAYVDAWIEERIDGDPTHRRQLHRLAALIASSTRAASPLVLDVGSGPGPLASAVLRALPHARVVCQDFSEPMLERARTALAWAGERVRYHRSDLAAPDWIEGLGKDFDAVVSSYAIHNLRDATRISSVYGDIASLLPPGGGVFLLDLVESPGSRTDTLYGRRRRHADDDVATLAAHLGWLAQAGFTEVDCLWKEGFEAAICGFRR